MTKNILVAVDLEDDALMTRILQAAGDIAGLHDAQITLVHVAANLPSDVRAHLPEDYEKGMTEQVAGKLDTEVESLNLPEGRVHVSVRVGRVYRKIVEEAEKLGADLVIVGGHRPDVTDFLLGSNAARIVRHAKCSVYVVR